ncbi:hypothetical protein GOD82_04210 [Sinorhizobium medicae]|nr:hypothetical protein [Sinorhizobium medicae]
MVLLQSVYELALIALREAQSQSDTKVVDGFLASHGFAETTPVDDKFMSAYFLSDADESVLLQYRYYDTSQAFSIRPDMNVYLLKFSASQKVIAEETVKFLDKSVYG